MPDVPVMPRPLSVKLATPDAKDSEVVPTRTPPADTVARIDPTCPVTVFPPESCTVTTGCVVNAAPDALPTDGVDNITWVGAPVLTVNCSDVDARPVLVNETEYERPATPVSPSVANVAKPSTALTVVVPTSSPVATPPTEIVVTDAVTAESVITKFPPASSMRTCGSMPNAAPESAD